MAVVVDIKTNTITVDDLGTFEISRYLDHNWKETVQADSFWAEVKLGRNTTYYRVS